MPVWNCLDLCRQFGPETCAECPYACPRRPAFAAMMRAVVGPDLTNTPRHSPTATPLLPPIVPYILHGYRRSDCLRTDWVAVPLHVLFERGTGKPLQGGRSELTRLLRIQPDTKLIVVGIAKDDVLEAYWYRARPAGILRAICDLMPDLVTTPNFSLFSNVPRWDNFVNMKRTALSCCELGSRGLNTVLSVVGRTPEDYRRWADFVAEREEIACLACEFATGAGQGDRIHWHVAQLLRLAGRVKRRLRLLTKGGRHVALRLSQAFDVTLIDSDPFMKAMKRRRFLCSQEGKRKWARVLTPDGRCLDEILQHNVDGVTSAADFRIEQKGSAAVPVSMVEPDISWAANSVGVTVCR
ncbi:MAG: DUF4417 domain-containing protein [Planctomycetota bacterium]|nr:DUF4417 domain-containing protein [Planctomycetota bacterium]